MYACRLTGAGYDTPICFCRYLKFVCIAKLYMLYLILYVISLFNTCLIYQCMIISHNIQPLFLRFNLIQEWSRNSYKYTQMIDCLTLLVLSCAILTWSMCTSTINVHIQSTKRKVTHMYLCKINREDLIVNLSQLCSGHCTRECAKWWKELQLARIELHRGPNRSCVHCVLFQYE